MVARKSLPILPVPEVEGEGTETSIVHEESGRHDAGTVLRSVVVNDAHE